MALLSSTPTWAAGAGVDCTYPGSYYIFLPPTNIQVGRDTAVGDLIGSWISTSATPTWSCYRPNTAYGVIHIGVAGYGPYTVFGNITADGRNHAIYNSAVKTGLGYIVRWRTTYNGTTSDWQALRAPGGVWVDPETMFGPIEFNDLIAFPLNVEIQVHFVKTATNLTAGNVSAFDPIYIQPQRSLNGGATVDKGPYRIVDYKANDLGIASGGTCTTPGVIVNLKKASVRDFSGVGSVAGLTPFNLAFNNCPANLNSIGYSFAATTSVVNAGNGVVALDSSSTASGVGIQLLREDDSPVVFGRVYNLDSYNPAISTSYTVPMKAGIYQISAPIGAGSVRSSVTFTMNYQ